MKRQIIAIVILILIFTVCIVSSVFLKKKTDSLSEKLSKTIGYVNQNAPEKADEEYERYLEEWESVEKLFLLCLRHDELDEITFSNEVALYYLNYREYPEFCAEAGRNVSQLSHIWESSKPAGYNFF